MLDMNFQYGWEPVIIHRVLIGFKAKQEIMLFFLYAPLCTKKVCIRSKVVSKSLKMWNYGQETSQAMCLCVCVCLYVCVCLQLGIKRRFSYLEINSSKDFIMKASLKILVNIQNSYYNKIFCRLRPHSPLGTVEGKKGREVWRTLKFNFRLKKKKFIEYLMFFCEGGGRDFSNGDFSLKGRGYKLSLDL